MIELDYDVGFLSEPLVLVRWSGFTPDKNIICVFNRSIDHSKLL